MLLTLLGAAWAACTFDQPATALVDAMQRAEAAYADLDVPAFQQATVEVDYLVPCLDAPLPPVEAARLHRLRGIGYHTSQRPADATAALRAARVAAPDWEPPLELFPEGFELRELYLELPAAPSATTKVPRPAGGHLLFDGTATQERPSDTSALVQVVVGEQVTTTAYVLPDEPLPAYRGATAPRDRWLVAGIGTVVTGGVLYGLAAATSAQRFDATDADELASVQRCTNTLVVASGAVTALSAVPFGIAWRVGRR